MLKIIKTVSFVIFTAMTVLLTANLFFNMVATPWEKGIMMVIAIALELTKVFSLVRASYLYHVGKFWKAFRSYVFYGLLAALSIFSSYGYTITTIENANITKTAETNTLEISIVQQQIDTLNFQIETEKKQLAILADKDEKGNQSKINDLNLSILNQTKRLGPLNEQLLALTKSDAKENVIIAKETFSLIANKIGWKEKDLMFLVLIIVSLLIELGIITTSPLIKLDEHQVDSGHYQTENKIDEEKPKKKVKEKITKQQKYDSMKEYIESQNKLEPKPVEELKEKIIPDLVTKELEPKKTEEVLEIKSVEEKKEVKKEKKETVIKNYVFGSYPEAYKNLFKAFVLAMFNNNGFSYLKDIDSSASEAGIKSELAVKFFDSLKAAQGRTGMNVIEKRQDKSNGISHYWPNYTKEYIVDFMTQETGGQNVK
jgi:hypothetical protein